MILFCYGTKEARIFFLGEPPQQSGLIKTCL